ncbi:ceramide glucosyltransferase [Rhizobium arsenicireducens]
MTVLFWICALALSVHLLSILTVLLHKRRIKPGTASTIRPPVTILRPLCGLENNLDETLATGFHLDWPDYEIVFCVASSSDPAIEVARRTMAAHPEVPARLLVGEDIFSVNPKMNNLIKGWRSAQHDWIVIADSNVLMAPDYLHRLFIRWIPGTGLVCSPPIGAAPQGFAAELECAWLNSFQARWQLLADAIGIGFAQGKSMLLNRQVMARAGGFERLGGEIAEDAAATALIRGIGLKVRLVTEPFDQPLGRRSLITVWRRQLRWARLRRASFPLFFLPEAPCRRRTADPDARRLDSGGYLLAADLHALRARLVWRRNAAFTGFPLAYGTHDAPRHDPSRFRFAGPVDHRLVRRWLCLARQYHVGRPRRNDEARGHRPHPPHRRQDEGTRQGVYGAAALTWTDA